MKRLVMCMGLVCAVTVPSAAVYAANDGAGCGLGQRILAGQSGVGANVGAAIINFLAGQIYSMTTGTSGCDTSKTVQNDQQRETFVADNMDNLNADMAKGQGEYLAALAQIMGVEAQDTPAFNRVAQEQYESIASAGSAREVLASLDGALVSDQSLAKYVR